MSIPPFNQVLGIVEVIEHYVIRIDKPIGDDFVVLPID